MKTLYLSFFMLVSASSFGQTFEWAIKAGGGMEDKARAITIADDGNIYHVGEFRFTCDFNPGPAVFNLTVAGSSLSSPDGYICKLSNNGSLIWAKQLSGPDGSESIQDIVLDHDNNLVVSGLFSDSADFDLGPGTNILGDGGSFVAKYDSSGNLIWVNRFDVYGAEVKIDDSNNVIIHSTLSGTIDCDPGPGVYNMTGQNDGVIIKLNSTGNFIWAKSLISTFAIGVLDMLIDNNYIYVSGALIGIADMDPGPGIYNLTNTSSFDGFVAKYDTAGNFIWAFSLFSPGSNENSNTIQADAAGNIVIAGNYSDTIDMDPGPGIYQMIPANQFNIFILKVDSASNFMWAKSLNVSSAEAMALTLDNDDEIYLTADFFTTGDFDPGPGTVNQTSAGNADVFMLKLNSTGDFQGVKRIGGIGYDRVYDIVVDSLDNVYACGVFDDLANFNPPNIVNLVSSGGYDIFVVKYSQSPVGINEIPITNSIKAFPNPTSGKFHILLQENEKLESIHITDMMGRSVRAFVTGENSEYEVNMDAQPGIYCARIYTDNNNYVTVLVRE